MQVKKFQNEEEWLQARRGKITGTRLKDVIVKRGTGRKIGFYELIAERIAVEPDGEDVMERGLRLEDEALELFTKETKKKVTNEMVLWCRDDNESIALSPDGIISEKEAVEVKCLGSARHIEALIENKIPSDYTDQALQYFIVNDELETLYFVFYDPRVQCKPFFYLTVKRDQEEVDKWLAYERELLAEIDQIVTDLTF